jgi:hypothetical protein
MAQHLSLPHLALNRYAIRAFVAGVVLIWDLLRGFWCWVCAVGRGDFASIDRGHSDEHSALHTNAPLRARMIFDMTGRDLGPASQTSHLRACKRFAAWLGRSPETAKPDDVKYFQQHLIESGASIGTRNQTMTGVKFLFRVTLRRHDLVAEIFHLKEPVKIPLVLSKKEIKRILAMAPSLKARVMLSLAYGCGMRAGAVVRLKVADIFCAHGAAWRAANAHSHRLQANDCRAMGHISLNRFKVMSAIERCRTAALGGPVARCADCAHEHIAYSSCRNRHCPECQAGAAKAWLAAREAELLPVRYFHLVFTLPKQIADIAHQNKREIYDLLMRASADTVIKFVPGGACLRMVQSGSPAARPSSCPSGFCPACTDDSFWKAWPSGTKLESCTSWVNMRAPLIAIPSTNFSDPCARPTGSFAPKNPSPGPNPCWPICRVTRTGWQYPTAA